MNKIEVTRAALAFANKFSEEVSGLSRDAEGSLARYAAAFRIEATTAKDAEIAELVALLRDLASEPPGGEIWERNDRFQAYAERAAAKLKDLGYE